MGSPRLGIWYEVTDEVVNSFAISSVVVFALVVVLVVCRVWLWDLLDATDGDLSFPVLLLFDRDSFGLFFVVVDPLGSQG